MVTPMPQPATNDELKYTTFFFSSSFWWHINIYHNCCSRPNENLMRSQIIIIIICLVGCLSVRLRQYLRNFCSRPCITSSLDISRWHWYDILDIVCVKVYILKIEPIVSAERDIRTLWHNSIQFHFGLAFEFQFSTCRCAHLRDFLSRSISIGSCVLCQQNATRQWRSTHVMTMCFLIRYASQSMQPKFI